MVFEEVYCSIDTYFELLKQACCLT